MRLSRRPRLVVGLAVVLTGSAIVLLASGCGAQAEPARAGEVDLAPIRSLPSELAEAPPRVQEAYRFALANPELLGQIPCFCGCGQVGHMSNLDCYAQRINPDGSAVFDRHALF